MARSSGRRPVCCLGELFRPASLGGEFGWCGVHEEDSGGEVKQARSLHG